MLVQAQKMNGDQTNAGDQTPQISEHIQLGPGPSGVAQSNSHSQIVHNPRLNHALILHFALLINGALQLWVFDSESEIVELVVGLLSIGSAVVKLTQCLH